MNGPAPDPRRDRQIKLTRFLQGAVLVALVASAAALVLPGRVGHDVAVAMVFLLIAAPLVRLAWLAGRWTRLRDYRFALAATGLILIVLSAAVVGTF